MAPLKKRSFTCISPVGIPGGTARCNRCVNCLHLAVWLKELRIRLEAQGHQGRVWLATLTFREETDDEKGYPLVQKWLKRVRAASPEAARLRYTCVCERGSRNDRLHYHLVIYANEEIKWRTLNRWDHGFSHYKLVSGRMAARYIAKYLSKGHGKVRSSQLLGVAHVKKSAEDPTVAAVLQLFPGSRIVAVAGTRVPRELSEPYVNTPQPPEYPSWEECGPDSGELISYTGVSGDVLKQWKKSHKEIDTAKRVYSRHSVKSADDSPTTDGENED